MIYYFLPRENLNNNKIVFFSIRAFCAIITKNNMSTFLRIAYPVCSQSLTDMKQAGEWNRTRAYPDKDVTMAVSCLTMSIEMYLTHRRDLNENVEPTSTWAFGL